MVTAPQLYFHIKKIFENNGLESPQFEAMCIAEHIFGKKLDRLLMDRTEATSDQVNFADSIAYRRISGEPLQYLLGKWEFFGMPFYVGKGVLIPRQDTETLVEAVIEMAAEYESPEIMDLCSGSGCIACAVAANVKNVCVSALEKSERAIGYLNKNAVENNVSIEIMQADVLNEKTAMECPDFDIIVCNPPYLTESDMKSLQKEVTFEPQEALFGGTDGLDFYREITRIWSRKLKSGGTLAYEIGFGQENDVRKIMLENKLVNIDFIRDLTGKIRVVMGKCAGN